MEDTGIRKLSRLYDATAWYWNSYLHFAMYRHSYVTFFKKLKAQGCLPQRCPLQVLDCGIGTGLLTDSLIAGLNGRLNLYGVDTSAKMLEGARLRLRNHADAHLLMGDLCLLPFRDCEMDLVMAALVLENVPTPLEALREMVRVTRPQSTIILITTRPHAPDLPFRLLFQYRPFRKARLLQWMNQAGIETIREEALCGLAHPFARAFVGTKPA